MVFLFTLVKASEFLPKYAGLPYNSTTRTKWRGLTYNGYDIGFTEEEWSKIMSGLDKMYEDLKKHGAEYVPPKHNVWENRRRKK